MNKEEKIEKNAILSCLLEISVNKPGNISRFYDFEETNYQHYLSASLSISNAIRKLLKDGLVGKAIYNAVKNSQEVQNTNLNLGIILLLFPLIKSAKGKDIRKNLKKTLDTMDYKDTVWIYKAINMARPSLLPINNFDVREKETLVNIKRQKIKIKDFFKTGAKFNNVCREYVSDYEIVFETSNLLLSVREKTNIENAIVHCFLYLLGKNLDYLIIVKNGIEKAVKTQKRSNKILKSGSVFTEKGKVEIKKFSKELRREKINPGSTADLITASLFIALMKELRI